MQWKEIEITDRELLQRAFENINSQASEMSFANMYMWRYNYNTRINVIENMLCMVSDSRRFIPFAFCPVPLGVFQPEEFRKAVMALKVYFNDQGWKLMFGRVEEKNLALFKRCPDFRATFKKIDANSDYVYNTESLIALAGKKIILRNVKGFLTNGVKKTMIANARLRRNVKNGLVPSSLTTGIAFRGLRGRLLV